MMVSQLINGLRFNQQKIFLLTRTVLCVPPKALAYLHSHSSLCISLNGKERELESLVATCFILMVHIMFHAIKI